MQDSGVINQVSDTNNQNQQVSPVQQIPQNPNPEQPTAVPTPQAVAPDISQNTTTVQNIEQSVQPTSILPPKSATDLLSSFAQDNFNEVQKVIKFVKQGYKLDNDAMQQLLLNLKTKHNMTYRDLLAVYLTLDKAVEKGALTNDLIDYMKEHPETLDKFDNASQE